MDNEQKYWLLFIATIAISICAFTLIMCLFSYKTQKEYIRSGYTQTSIPGIRGPVWQKGKPQ